MIFLDAGTRVRDNAFKITVDTTQAGSASDTFVLPLVSGESYDFEVDWGDGVIESVSGSSLSSKSHTYSSGGTYQIAITGTFPRIYFNNGGDKLKLSSIDNWGDIVWSSMLNAFYGCSNMVGTYTDVPNTSSVTNMGAMFRDCSSFNSPVNFDTSSVTTMSNMFRGCSSFNQSVSSFDTSLVTTMVNMFFNCSSFNQPVSNFDTSLVTTMVNMFFGCSSFNQPVSNFDTSLVTTMVNMFFGCSSFKQSLATFDMTSVTNVTDMLLGCDINEAGTTTNYDNTLIAWEAQDLVDSLSFNGGNSKYGFNAALARQAIIDDDSWTITDGGYSDVSADYSDAFQITVDTTQAGSASDTMEIPLVSGTTYSYFVDWGDGSGEMVQGSALTTSSKTYSTGGTYQIAITGDFPRIYFNNGGDKLKLSSIDNWGDIVWSSMLYAFWGCSNMVGTYTDAPNTSSVTNMSYMFRDCSSFNSPVNFDTSSVTTMSNMLRGCYSFNQSVSNFDTSLVTSMNFMFFGCSSFNQSVSNFDTSSVTNMSYMFSGCSSFNQSVSNFDTSSVTNMSYMFSGCSSFNQSVNSFDTSLVTTMQDMFRNCSSFKQSLATFDMTSVANVTNMLLGCDINESGTTTNYDNTLIAWELQDLVDSLSFHGGTSKYSTTAAAARDAIINDDSWVITDGGYEAVNAEYQDVLDYADSQGYQNPSSSQQVLQDSLVGDLKAAGVWSKLDAFSVFATDGDSDFALIDWIRLSTQTAVNSPTFTADSGFNGDGVSSYINTTFTISTDATNYTQNNASTFAYIDVDVSDTDNGIYGARVEETTENRNQLRIRDVDYRPAINDIRPIIASDYRSSNWHHQKRTASTGFTTYLDGTNFTNSISSENPSLINTPIYLLAINFVNNIGANNTIYYSSSTIKVFGIGEALDDTALKNAINTYISAI